MLSALANPKRLDLKGSDFIQTSAVDIKAWLSVTMMSLFMGLLLMLVCEVWLEIHIVTAGTFFASGQGRTQSHLQTELQECQNVQR